MTYMLRLEVDTERVWIRWYAPVRAVSRRHAIDKGLALVTAHPDYVASDEMTRGGEATIVDAAEATARRREVK